MGLWVGRRHPRSRAASSQRSRSKRQEPPRSRSKRQEPPRRRYFLLNFQAAVAPREFGGWLCPPGAGVDAAQVTAEAERIRMACLAERLADEAGSSSQYARVLVAGKPLLATGPGGPTGCRWAFGGYSLNEVGKNQDGWQLLSMAIDSGAAETVIPHRLVSQHPLKETNASRSGLCYSSATGQPIPSLGEECFILFTMEETFRGMTFQAAPVSKPLGSVKRICAAGRRFVFGEDGS